MKGVKISSFHRAPQSWSCIKKGEQKSNGEQITVSTNEIYQLDFLKEVLLNRSIKEAVTIRRAPCRKFSIS